MKRIFFAVLAFAVLISVSSAYGWNSAGHCTIGHIADQHLTPKARKMCDKYLGHSLAYYASWMDQWRYSKEYHHTARWHAVGIKDGKLIPAELVGDISIFRAPLTDDEHGVARMEQMLDALKDYRKMSDSAVVVNLKCLIHMVGDMHCPMHAGRLSDRGGNDTKVKWFGEKTSMHSVWDSKMIESARRWGYQEWVEQLDRKDKKFIKEITKGTYEEWFMQTVSNAARFYEYVESMPGHNPNLSYKFVFDFSPTLEECLILGGYRLAYVRNTIFG